MSRICRLILFLLINMPETLNAQLSESLPLQDNAFTRNAGEVLPLCWRVHLLKRDPSRLPALLLVLGVGVVCVWLMFGTLLPVLAAAMLLLGSVSEYLFPIAYRLTAEGICQEALTSRVQLPWSDVRRLRIGRDGLLLTSLPTASRLDAFRGILLRFAPDGQIGDEASLYAAIAHYAPQILPGNVAARSDDEMDNSDATDRSQIEPER